VPPRGLSWDQLFKGCLGFIHFFFLGCHLFFEGFYHAFNELYFRGLRRVSCQLWVLGFGGLCFGNKSRQPSCHVTDIPTIQYNTNNIKTHWPCAVKIHFAQQHRRRARNHANVNPGLVCSVDEL